MTPRHHLIIYLVLAILLLAGSKEARFKKAALLSKTLYFPFISSVNWIQSKIDLKQDNGRLYNEIARKNISLNQLHQELEFYRKQKTKYGSFGYDYITTNVVGVNGVFGQEYFVLDKGSLAGIRMNMPVLGTNGVVGKIVGLGANYSLLLPVTNSSFKLGVMLNSNYLQGLLEADLNGQVFMNILPVGSEVSIGDTIVTSNLSQVFPPYFPVGTVAGLRQTSDLVNISAEVDLFSSINSLTTVIVLLYESEDNFQEELELKNESDY